MKKVNWTWYLGVYVPLCPYCNEPAYEKKKCVFCGKKFEWVEGEIKPTVIEHEGYTIIQETNNHIQIYKDNHLVMHASCTKKMTEEELKKEVEFLRNMRGGKKKTCDSCIHYGLCQLHADKQPNMTVEDCHYFKDKSRFVEVPEGAVVLTRKEIAALNNYALKHFKDGDLDGCK